MYLSNFTLLILACSLASILLIALIINLSALRRERNKAILLSARQEMHSEEITVLAQTCERLRDERTQQFEQNRELQVRSIYRHNSFAMDEFTFQHTVKLLIILFISVLTSF